MFYTQPPNIFVCQNIKLHALSSITISKTLKIPFKISACSGYSKYQSCTLMDEQPRMNMHSSRNTDVPGGGGPEKVSKKRSRASKRTPTTVLNTDASNFRAMVQHFTGLPPTASYGSSSYSPDFGAENSLPRPLPRRVFMNHIPLPTGLGILDTSTMPAVISQGAHNLAAHGYMKPSFYSPEVPPRSTSQEQAAMTGINVSTVWDDMLSLNHSATHIHL